MIKVGDRVAPFDNMGQTGTVVGMYQQKSNQWMVGGAMQAIFIIKVRLDHDGTEIELRADKLMRVD